MFPTDESTDTLPVLLQSGCPDCIAVKKKDIINTFLLLSKKIDVKVFPIIGI